MAKVLLLKSVAYKGGELRSDFNSEFIYPTSGEVSAPDWRSDAECGHGIHGFLWGVGDSSLARGMMDGVDATRWLVLEADDGELVKLDNMKNGWPGKVKVPKATVVGVYERIVDAAKHILNYACYTDVDYWTIRTSIMGGADADSNIGLRTEPGTENYSVSISGYTVKCINRGLLQAHRGSVIAVADSITFGGGIGLRILADERSYICVDVGTMVVLPSGDVHVVTEGESGKLLYAGLTNLWAADGALPYYIKHPLKFAHLNWPHIFPKLVD